MLTEDDFHSAHECVQLIVYALQRFDDTSQGLYLEARQKVRELQDDDVMTYTHAMDILKAWILIGIFEFGTDQYRRSWASIGMATRLVTCMSMERLESWVGRPIRNEHRIVFWHVFMADRLASWTTGFTPGLPDDITTFLCENNGESLGFGIRDWRGRDLPSFAALSVAVSFFVRNERLKVSGTLPQFEQTAAELQELANCAKDKLPNLIIQAGLLQLWTYAIEKKYPCHGRLKFAAFRTFLQLGSIDADLGLYNFILYHSLFKAGCALLLLLDQFEQNINVEYTKTELSQGLVVISTMLKNLSKYPGARSVSAQIQAGMEGQKMLVSVPEIVKSRLPSMKSTEVKFDELDMLLAMFAQANEVDQIY